MKNRTSADLLEDRTSFDADAYRQSGNVLHGHLNDGGFRTIGAPGHVACALEWVGQFKVRGLADAWHGRGGHDAGVAQRHMARPPGAGN